MDTSIGEIRDRANSVLDGMTGNRTRVAKDCLLLCDEIQRLRTAMVELTGVPEKETMFDSIFGKKP